MARKHKQLVVFWLVASLIGTGIWVVWAQGSGYEQVWLALNSLIAREAEKTWEQRMLFNGEPGYIALYRGKTGILTKLQRHMEAGGWQKTKEIMEPALAHSYTYTKMESVSCTLEVWPKSGAEYVLVRLVSHSPTAQKQNQTTLAHMVGVVPLYSIVVRTKSGFVFTVIGQGEDEGRYQQQLRQSGWRKLQAPYEEGLAWSTWDNGDTHLFLPRKVDKTGLLLLWGTSKQKGGNTFVGL